MSTNNPNSRRAGRSDAAAASAGKPPEADRAPAGGTGPAVPPAGPDPIPPVDAGALASGRAVAGGDPADGVASGAADGVQPAPLHTDTSIAAMAAAAVITETRPQDAARTLGAAAGSATEAPSLGAGALADVAGGLAEAPGAAAVPTEKVVGPAAGIPPGRFSAAGAYGGVAGSAPAELEGRPWMMHGLITDRTVTGAKLALARPATPEALADAVDAGFDFEVTSRQLNFRRAGVVHPITPTLRRTEDFTAEELKLLRSEPLLVVRLL